MLPIDRNTVQELYKDTEFCNNTLIQDCVRVIADEFEDNSALPKFDQV